MKIKKSAAAVLSGLVCISSAGTCSAGAVYYQPETISRIAADDDVILGDVNGDGLIDTVDASCILSYVQGSGNLSNPQKVAADVNKDGSIDSTDALIIQKYYASASSDENPGTMEEFVASLYADEETADTTTTTAAVTTTAVTTTTAVVTTSDEQQDEDALILGDVNMDGRVDATDASMILKESSELAAGGGSFNEAQLKAADVNQDGIVDASDASDVLRYYSYLMAGYDYVGISEFLRSNIELSRSGSCGKNAVWGLNEDGVLTIGGTGEMTSWSSTTDVPWHDLRGEVKKVVIEDGITNIGSCSFYGCKQLTEAEIPESVEDIGFWVFSGTPYLEASRSAKDPMLIINGILVDGAMCGSEVEVPTNVTKIAPYAFSYSDTVMSVRIPASVTEIGKKAFFSCPSLNDVTVIGTKCDIYNDKNTFCNGVSDEAVYGGVLVGYDDSTVKEYADKFGISFQSIGQIQQVSTDIVMYVGQTIEIAGLSTTVGTSDYTIEGEKVTALKPCESYLSIGGQISKLKIMQPMLRVYADDELIESGAVISYKNGMKLRFELSHYYPIGSTMNAWSVLQKTEKGSSSSNWNKSFGYKEPAEEYNEAENSLSLTFTIENVPDEDLNGRLCWRINNAVSIEFESNSFVIAAPLYRTGDVNGDKDIDARDASNILAEYAAVQTNKPALFNAEQKEAADVDGNGVVDARDASDVLAYYAYTSTHQNEQVDSIEVFLKK